MKANRKTSNDIKYIKLALAVAIRNGCVLAALAVMLGTCATPSTGPDFARPNFTGSAPKLAEVEIIRQLGQPFSRGQLLKHGQLVSTLNYFRLTGEWGDRVRYRKRCLFFFADRKYLGFSYFSGAPQDQVSFDERQVANIIKGKTSKSEVLSMFGSPNAVLLYPATPDATGLPDLATREGDFLFDYGYHVFKLDGTWFENKDLRIVFDPNGIAKDVIFAASRKNAKSGNDSSDPGL
jgi:hypothetical protein